MVTTRAQGFFELLLAWSPGLASFCLSVARSRWNRVKGEARREFFLSFLLALLIFPPIGLGDGKISVLLHTSLCIHYLDERKQLQNDRLLMVLGICFRVVWAEMEFFSQKLSVLVIDI